MKKRVHTSWNMRCQVVLVFIPGEMGYGGNVCAVRAMRATFVLSILTLTPDLPSPRAVPQADTRTTRST